MTVPFDTTPATGDERAFQPHEPRSLPVVVGNRLRVRASVVAVLAALGLAIVVVAVAGFLLLPSATIALTPRQDVVGPIQVTIAADPTATAVDATKGVVPADRLDVPAEASQTFTTTGTKITEAAATGSVTFTNYDPTSSNSIAAGSIVSTEGGIGFRTLAAVTVARAAFTPPSTTVPAHASVRVQAVKAGTEGNVPANAIRVVPPGENPTFLAVANPNATSGGVHTETPQVSKAEVDKAVATLQKALQASFDDAISAGAGAPTGTELFPSTAAMGAPTFSVDPATLVGQAVGTFDLGATASGTVIAVDPSPVRSIAEARLRGRIGADHRLVDGSIQVDVGKGSVGEDGQVSFEATARAAEVTVVDLSQLRALVKGMTASEAESALAPFGVAKVELWPAWVTTVTGVDARLSISVVGQDGAGSGGAGSPAPSGGVAPSTSTSAPSAASPGASPPSPSAASAAP
ncbi:MAG TPA: baseplate J/gp47 family protein [Candidatus Bathyarchaeia archaeon]|nr:baseplate J/gp47 family protein [Candidatus Bathyarchaeia archaeon]